MKKAILFLFVILFVTSMDTFAQVGSISGTITDERTGEPLPGVNIFIQELERGASTNIDGEFTILSIPYGTYNVRITFVGFRAIAQEIEVDSEMETMNFVLTEDLVGMDEIVVTGQGSGVAKKRLSTTVNSISAKQIEALPTVQLDQLLQANLPNSQIRLSSGQPGTASLIRGRGVNSALTATTPVIYIDGVRVDATTGQSTGFGTGGAQSSAIADIPVENIERVEFIKGGAATTQFGSDAANGVIQIFTKKGVQGRTTLNFESRLGSSVGTKQFLRFKETADILFDPGFVQEYRLSGSGGTSAMTFSFAGSMMKDEGFRLVNDEIRHNLRGTVSADVTNWVRYTGSIGFTSNEFKRDFNANTSFSAFGNLEGGSEGDVANMDPAELSELKEEIRSFVGLVNNETDVKRFQTSHQLDFDIMRGFTGKASIGLDSRKSKERQIITNQFLVAGGFDPPGTTDQGFLGQNDRDFLGVTLETNLRYEFDYNDFSSISTVGFQLFRDDDRQLRVDGDGLPDGSTNVNSSADITGEDFRRTVANYGYFILQNIGFKDRYFIEGGIRVDQNSAFGDQVNAQLFPKVGVSYNVDDESFFQNSGLGNIISTLKLRANLGWAGNFPTPFSNQVLASTNPFLGGLALEFGTPGDSELRPEKTRTIEVGADLALINERIIFEFTYFDAKTKDALFSAPFASSFGLGTALQNLGEIENTGIELAGNFGLLRQRDVSVNLRASVNTLTNEVTDNGNSAAFAVGGFQFLGSFVDEGEPVGFLRGNRSIFDDDGNVVDVINNDVLGSPIPDIFGSLSINSNYKRLSFTMTADYQLGAQGVAVDDVLRFFSGLSDEGRIPENANPPGGFFDLASVWVENTDYFKIRLFSLGYTLPEKFYQNIARSVRLGFTVTNPVNFATSSFDPEVSGAGLTRGGQGGIGVGGFGFGTESPPRQFMGSININF